MAHEFLVDQYQQAAQPEILARARWAADTHDHYGFTPATAVVQGTRALDMYGIDSRLPGSRAANLPLDLDVIVAPGEISRLNRDFFEDYSEDDMERTFAEPRPHLFQAFQPPRLDAVSLMYAGTESRRVDFETASATSETISVLGRTGLYRVLTPYAAASGKLSGLEKKDVFGVLYAHVSAYRQDLAVVRTDEWRVMARRALSIAYTHSKQERPDWVNDPLGFVLHPACQDIITS